MKKVTQLKSPFIFLLLPLIFIAGCKKNNLNPNNTANTGKILFTQHAQIWTVSTDGKDAKRINITLPANEQIDGSSPQISPDGNTVFFDAYLMDNSNNIIGHQIFSCSINGGTAVLLVSSNNNQTNYHINAVYTEQQQTKIIYTQWINSGYPNIFKAFTANADGSNAQQINLALPNNVQLYGLTVKLSSDNSTLYFTALSPYLLPSNSALYSANLDGSNVKKLVGVNFASIGAYSTTGTQAKVFYADYIYVSSVNQGTYSRLYQDYSINADGTDQQQINLTFPSNQETTYLAPIVSKDGKLIYFISSKYVTYQQVIVNLYQANVDGSNLKLLLTLNADSSFALGNVF